MNLSRRTFLTAAGACGLALGLPARARAESPVGGRHARLLMDRCAFGPRPGDLARVAELGVEGFLQEQLHPATLDDTTCDRRVRRLETLQCPTGELFEYHEELLWNELASGKLLRAVYSRRQLYEVMVDFWTDHFNVDISKGDCAWLKTADDREVIRKHALGKFPDMLRASALGPAMLWYLDGRTNRKRTPDEKPNENYARELLELHTLGVRGGYTQEDVMEAARCLTGWTVRTDTWFGKGRVEFIPGHHDPGHKRVLGEEIPPGLGEADVDRLLSILMRHAGTPRFIAEKLGRRFIGPNCPEELVTAVADAFSRTGGDIPSGLRVLFSSAAFLDAGSPRFKRPFNFIASALRACEAEVRDADALLDYLARMGQSPFQYPTPDGYPDDPESWYGSMLWRWHFAYNLSRNEIAGVVVDWDGLAKRAGGGDALLTQLLGHAPGPEERQLAQSGRAPGLVLASPAFQGC